MELLRFPSRGGFSVRSILIFVLAAFTTVLLWALASTTPVNAADPAAWSNSTTILYDTHVYSRDEDFKDPTGTIPDDAMVYKTPPIPIDNSTDQKVFVIYYSSGVDPPTAATSANYVEFTYKNGQLSNAQNKQTITVKPQGEATARESSCQVSGIGWIVCPVSLFLADAMDYAFNVLSDLIAVKPPVLGDTSNSMYVAWNYMRTVANLAFVIAFLIIIYSQLTSIGISNYGIKRLLPRLIVAAVLVNISYYIAAFAIDVSNIAGYSIQNIFNLMRENLFHLTNDNINGLNTDEQWGQLTTMLLAGGGVIGITYFVSSGGVMAVLFPLLIGLILTLIFVLLILAARQAIILILVIIAPLAFVANLLPNTEKWFDKWRDLFMTMLIFFPAFSLVFGGSQLAGQLIIQNAGNNPLLLIFGMAIQVAPLVITPIILKFSGNLLGRIAQIANDPRRGMLDRAKNYGKEMGELKRQKSRASTNPLNIGASMVRAAENGRTRRKTRTDMYKQRADNMWHSSAAYEKLHEDAAEADLEKQAIENRNNAHIQKKANVDGSLLNVRTLELENAKVMAENANAETGSILSAYRAGEYRPNANTAFAQERLGKLQATMAENVIQTAAWKQADENNKYLQQRNISTRMRSDEGLLKIAQGSGDADMQLIGRERAQATAVATLTKLNRDARENVISLMETEAVEKKMSVKDYAVEKFKLANSRDPSVRQTISKTQLEAALEIAASDGQVTVFDDARASEHIDQTIVDAVVARHVGDMKAKGGFHIQANPELSLQRYIEKFEKGEFKPDDKVNSRDDAIAKFFHDQKIARLETLSNTTSANLGGVKFGAFTRLATDMVPPPGSGKPSLLDVLPNKYEDLTENQADIVENIMQSLRDGLSDPSTRATMNDRLKYARNMEEAIRKRFFPDLPPLELSENERSRAGGSPRPKSVADATPLETPDVDPTAESPSEDLN